MTQLTVQYLSDTPDLAGLQAAQVQTELQDAFQILPIDTVITGWSLPAALADACRDECQRNGAAHYRWHLLLTGDGRFTARPEWRVMGLDGLPMPGYGGAPDFTFMCPNNPEVQAAVLAHLVEMVPPGLYDGIFLDRVRFPSLGADIAHNLGCFCPYCQQAAREQDIDLEEIQAFLLTQLEKPSGQRELVRLLLRPGGLYTETPAASAVRAMLTFRARSITRLVHQVRDWTDAHGLKLGLDCFSSSIARLVGQDLRMLCGVSDWIKIMTYAHTFGPAGLPFEYLGLIDFLMTSGLDEAAALKWLESASSLEFPRTRQELAETGFSSTALRQEVERAISGCAPVLVGIEMVDSPGLTQINLEQLARDLAVVRAAHPIGLALSWDLHFIPRKYLELVAKDWS